MCNSNTALSPYGDTEGITAGAAGPLKRDLDAAAAKGGDGSTSTCRSTIRDVTSLNRRDGCTRTARVVTSAWLIRDLSVTRSSGVSHGPRGVENS